VYPRAYSISSYTAKSVGAILSGRYPSTLYRGPSFFTEYSKANLFFPELLQEKGVVTMAGHAHLYFERSVNMRQGFDTWRLVPGLTWNAETDESVTSPKTTELAIELLGDPKNTKGRFFLWLHYMDPHDKYLQHEEAPRFGRRARDLYHNEVYFTDLHIGKLLDWCEKQPWWKQTALIVSADHGEAFGEHDQWKHAFALWEVLTRVPLMVHAPGIKPRKIDARRSHIDFAPTIVDLLGEQPHKDFAGKSMVPELYGAEPDDREPILLDLPADRFNPPTRVAVKGDFKLIEDPGPKYHLYNIKDDPGELNNLVDNPKHAEDYKRMKKIFDDAWAKHPFVAPFGGGKLVGDGKADGPEGPPGWKDPDKKN
jgi:arylsulfatase A-like enzyme